MRGIADKRHGSACFIAIVIFAVAGCGFRSWGSGYGGGLAVTYDVQGPGGGLHFNGSTATVTFERGSVVIENSQIRVNGKDVAKVPSGSKAVDVHYAGNTLTIKADGAVVYEWHIEPGQAQPSK
jgi:hypothetical protein